MKPEPFCPACGRRLTASPRICAKCKKVIGHHHKFYFDGSTVYHKDCNDPTSYPHRLAGRAKKGRV